MNIDLRALKKQEGYKIKVGGEISISKNQLLDRQQITPFVYDIEYMYTDGKLFFEGKGSCKFSTDCYRCGKPTQYNVTVDFYDIIDLSDNDYGVVDEKFPLDRFIDEKIILNQPTCVLCSKNCKGLCGVCGNNKNVKDCNCESEIQKDNPFYALRQSLNDDK